MIPIVTFILAGVLASPARAPSQDDRRPAAEAEALELFRSSCLTCHAPPDRRFAVDRAWLRQVADTA